jgi:hypothetical protein
MGRYIDVLLSQRRLHFIPHPHRPADDTEYSNDFCYLQSLRARLSGDKHNFYSAVWDLFKIHEII